MEAFVQMAKRQAGDVGRSIGQPRWGYVQSVDPTRPAVRVVMQPEGVLSGWLPIALGGAGAGASLVAVPSPGWMAFVIPDMGDAEHGVVVGFSHNDAAGLPVPPNAPGTGGTPSSSPAAWQAGEVGIVKGSTVIRLCADGTIYIKGTVKVDGDLRVNGDIFDKIGSIGGFRTHYNAHTHTDPQGGSVGPASPQDP